MDMQIMMFRLRGTAPLLVQSNALVDPLNPFKKEIAKLTAKGRKKTDADHAAIYRLEFEANLYFDPVIGPYIPAINLDACMRDAARQVRLGAAVERGFMVIDDKVCIEYGGPRDIEGLYADRRFVDIRPVVLNGKSTMRCRPRFGEWALLFEIAYEPTQLDREQVIDIAGRAGRYVGVGTFRPRHGRFAVEVVNG